MLLDFSSTRIFIKIQNKSQKFEKKYTYLHRHNCLHLKRNSTRRLEWIEIGECPKTLKELFSPISTNPPSCIVLWDITTSHFKLKPQIINLPPNFQDLERKDQYMHVKDFLQYLNFKTSRTIQYDSVCFLSR